MKSYNVAREGTDKANANINEGSTYMKLYKTTMLMIPSLESPYILMIPNSKVLLSTLIIKRE